jgi:hypothetical protein
VATAEDYPWLEEVFSDAGCVTLVKGRTVEEVLVAFRADTSVEVLIQDAYGTGEEGFVSVIRSGDGVVAFEYNGFQGSLPEIVSAVSAGGARAASMFWNVNDDNAFTCAKDGELVVTVDMYDAEAGDDLDEDLDLPEHVRSLWVAAADEDADLHALGVAMAVTFAGVDVSREAIEAVQFAYRYQMR